LSVEFSYTLYSFENLYKHKYERDKEREREREVDIISIKLFSCRNEICAVKIFLLERTLKAYFSVLMQMRLVAST